MFSEAFGVHFPSPAESTSALFLLLSLSFPCGRVSRGFLIRCSSYIPTSEGFFPSSFPRNDDTTKKTVEPSNGAVIVRTFSTFSALFNHREWSVKYTSYVSFFHRESLDLLSLEREAQFGFYFSHFRFDSVRPTLPNTADVGTIHCRTPK